LPYTYSPPEFSFISLIYAKFNIQLQNCPVKFYQAIFEEPPSCPSDILPPKGEGAKVHNKQILAPFGGKWRDSVERGHEIHVLIICKNISLQKFIRHNYLFSAGLLTTNVFLTVQY